MTPFGIMHWYTLSWLLCCCGAAVLVARYRNQFAFLDKNYWRLQSEPWKVITATVATLGLVVMAPYTGDPTWDYVDALYMSLLTCAFAPWVVGTLYRFVRRSASLSQLFVAVCLWLFTASWSYDLYIWLRDGFYPQTWTSNLVASSFLYLMGGLVWSLEWRPGIGMTFSFLRNDWPTPVFQTEFRHVAWLALPIMLLIAFLMLRFLAP